MRRPSMELRARAGFALPLVILALVVMTAGLAAGFTATSAEITTNASQRSQARAFSIAQGGLEAFMVRRAEPGFCSNCVADPGAAAADSEWTRVTLPGGYADVVSVRVRPAGPNTSALYFIRSRGRDTSLRVAGKSSVFAERAVGMFAAWQTSNMQVLSAWTSLNGLTKNGTGTISGIDACGVTGPLPGSVIPKGDFVLKGEPATFEGAPPLDTSRTYQQLAAEMRIDWQGILTGGALPFDIVIPGGTFPSAAFFAANPNYWPIIRVRTNNWSLPNQGRGIIVADSNMSITGSDMWDGVVLVGGQLTSNGNNTTSGSVVSGLNRLIGGAVPANSVDNSDANGQKTYEYNSCHVSRATSRLQGYRALPNSWVDNVPLW
jgi:hypothetical protein